MTLLRKWLVLLAASAGTFGCALLHDGAKPDVNPDSSLHRPLQNSTNRYGLHVVSSRGVYEKTLANDPEKRLVDLAQAIPSILLDLRYATTNNFMKRQLYPVARALLRTPAAAALRAVQSDLAADGLGLKVYDAYRPYRVTEMMWEPYKNPDYVADPAKGSRHNRGAAVDVSLVELRSGIEITMPTPYDEFSPRAHHEFKELPEDVLRNRARLRSAMERHGFKAFESEWWHYDFGGWEKFELLDVPLEDF